MARSKGKASATALSASQLADTLQSTLTGKDPGLHIDTCLAAIDELRRLEAREASLLALLGLTDKLLIASRDYVEEREPQSYLDAQYDPVLQYLADVLHPGAPGSLVKPTSPTLRTTSDRAATVDPRTKWLPITKTSKPYSGAKVLLINREAGVAQIAPFRDDGWYTHFAGLPVFED